MGGILTWLRRNRAKAVTIAVIVAVVAWFLWPEGPEAPPPPTTAPVVRGDIEQLIAAAGTLEAGNVVDVGAQVSGQLRKLHVRLGDLVSEGDTLAEIDDFIQGTRVTSAEANLEGQPDARPRGPQAPGAPDGGARPPPRWSMTGRW